MQRLIGRIGKAHGIRGEVTVVVHTDDPDQRFAIGSELLTDPPERGPLRVRSARAASGKMVIGFEAVADRAAAESLRGTLLVIDTENLPPIDDEDEFYDHELEGMSVVTLDGTRLGVVTEVVHGPAGETLAVQAAESGTEVLIPFVAAIVPTVDRASATITVELPEGLLEL